MKHSTVELLKSGGWTIWQVGTSGGKGKEAAWNKTPPMWCPDAIMKGVVYIPREIRPMSSCCCGRHAIALATLFIFI